MTLGLKVSRASTDQWVNEFRFTRGINPELILFFNDIQVKYLLEYRLQWGKPDTLSLLKSAIVDNDAKNLNDGASYQNSGDSEYFKSDTPPSLISIIQNDWPYSGRAFPPLPHSAWLIRTH